MFLQTLLDFTILFTIGLIGWFILSLLHLPAVELIGPLILIGTLRALQADLPDAPGFLYPVVQVMIGIYVGSMITWEKIRGLKSIAPAGVVVLLWALAIAFVLGFCLAHYSTIDLYTALLAASMGGLPEITLVAIASGASLAIVIVAQMIRTLGTVIFFPIIFSRMKNGNPAENSEAENADNASRGKRKTTLPRTIASYKSRLKNFCSQERIIRRFNAFLSSWKRISITLAAAAAGGLILEYAGLPAGLLVGAMVFTAAVSLTGIPTIKLPPRLIDLVLVLMGIVVADNISLATFATLAEPRLLFPILAVTLLMFITSFIMSWVVCRLTGWDYPTSFLAAAPGGFTVITAMAIKHHYNAFNISIIHLCRLLTINILIPVVFLFLMRR
ncbi:MAG: AbrB family transcriptional regulator [Bacillota bacterium]|nr:AbrB family transcriptional regulator [Bacillota bacterium]